MKPALLVLLFLLIAIYSVNVEGSKCKCLRKGPKIRFSDVQKLEIKPRYPYCEEKMIIVTMQNMSRFRGQHYCLHPKLHSTKKLIKWYTLWKEKHRLQLSRVKTSFMNRGLSRESFKLFKVAKAVY